MEMKFYRCIHCGNIVAAVEESGVPLVCCGDNMQELVANSTDGAGEKHVPVYYVINNTVKVRVGELDHPMTDEHYIQWIAIETTNGNQRKCLKSSDKPEACFALCDGDKVLAVYEYCNLHGLWVAKA